MFLRHIAIFLAASGCTVLTGCANAGNQSVVRSLQDDYNTLHQKYDEQGAALTNAQFDLAQARRGACPPAASPPSALQQAWDETVKLTTEAWDSQAAQDARARLAKAMHDLTESATK